MADDNITIVAWPEKPAYLHHQFDTERPVPVSIRFEDAPARVALESSPESPVNIDAALRLSASEPVPVSIGVSYPICADSTYTIGLTIFDRPVAEITVRGRTRFAPCREEG